MRLNFLLKPFQLRRGSNIQNLFRNTNYTPNSVHCFPTFGLHRLSANYSLNIRHVAIWAEVREAGAHKHSVEQAVHAVPIADFDSGEKKRV